jgi:ornithine carbamoyltransferase
MVTARPTLQAKATRSAPAIFQQTDLLSISDLSPYDVHEIFALTSDIKARPGMFSTALKGRQYVMMFEKPSLRTRVTFETGINSLGGHALFMECPGGIESREKAADVARNLERWVQGIVLRTFKHSTVTEMAANANIPVINALTDREHPCQALADYFTLREKFGDLKNVKLAFVGDGNNVAHSLMLTAANLGSHFALATPKGYEPAEYIVQAAHKIAARTGAKIDIGNHPEEAVSGADAIYTDVWASMGQESEAGKREALFRPFQVNSGLMSLAAPHAAFMHCLPAHRGHEVTDEVLDSEQSVVYDEAENRLHVQNAILVLLAGTSKGGTKSAPSIRAGRA